MSKPQDAELADELASLARGNLTGPNLIIARMSAYLRDLRRQMGTYAEQKTEYDRLCSRIVVTMRNEGEKNYDVCKHVAHMDDAVNAAHLAYRLAEQLITLDREALRVLHAQLDAYRTEAADQRAADQFQARTQP